MGIACVTQSKWRSLWRRGLIGVFALSLASAGLEHMLEIRETARLTASDTFYPASKGRKSAIA